MKNSNFIVITILFFLVLFLGNKNIQYKAKLNDLTNFKDSLLGKYHIKKDIALKQFILINELDSLKSNCKKCNRYPIYETRMEKD